MFNLWNFRVSIIQFGYLYRAAHVLGALALHLLEEHDVELIPWAGTAWLSIILQ